MDNRAGYACRWWNEYNKNVRLKLIIRIKYLVRKSSIVIASVVFTFFP